MNAVHGQNYNADFSPVKAPDGKTHIFRPGQYIKKDVVVPQNSIAYEIESGVYRVIPNDTKKYKTIMNEKVNSNKLKIRF